MSSTRARVTFPENHTSSRPPSQLHPATAALCRLKKSLKAPGTQTANIPRVMASLRTPTLLLILIRKNFAGAPPKAEEFFHDVSDETGIRKIEVTAIGGGGDGEMGEFETRKLWKDVADGIREGDFEKASREKGRIEVRLLITLPGGYNVLTRSRMIKDNGEKTSRLLGRLGSLSILPNWRTIPFVSDIQTRRVVFL